eukprot:GHVS01012021.1.p1 GENE.GHVS01012021.1~~GHVS01012021.1.p1  ORF type:complete len:223 (+),score=74.39 GHVS01012021.1:284-952(+)
MEETIQVKQDPDIVKKESSSDDEPIVAVKRETSRKKRKLESDGESDDEDKPLVASTKKKGKGKKAAAAVKKKMKPAPVKKKKAAGGGARGGRAGEPAAAVKKKRASRVKKEEGEEGGEEEHIPGDARKYFKEGQKHITPPNGDGTRAFYESLYDDNPNSLIALKFCVEFGVLTGSKHHTALAHFEALKAMGAYKGPPGGIRPEFAEGPPKKILAKFERRTHA